MCEFFSGRIVHSVQSAPSNLEFGDLTPILDAMPRPLMTASFLSVGVLLLAFILILAILVLRQDRLLYFPTHALASNPPAFGLRADDLTLRAEDGVPLHGWWIKGEGRRALLFFHGNAGNVADRTARYDQFSKMHLNTIAVNYPGFGESEGEPSETGFYQTADACYAYLTHVRKILPRHILIYGHSLGSGAAVDLASRVEAAAVIIEGAVTSVPDRGQELYPYFPIKLIAGIKFASIEKIDRIKYPKLIIHATDDEINPIQHGRKLFNKAIEPKTFLEVHGGHNYANANDRENFERGLKAFIATLGIEPTKNMK